MKRENATRDSEPALPARTGIEEREKRDEQNKDIHADKKEREWERVDTPVEEVRE